MRVEQINIISFRVLTLTVTKTATCVQCKQNGQLK